MPVLCPLIAAMRGNENAFVQIEASGVLLKINKVISEETFKHMYLVGPRTIDEETSLASQKL